MVVHHQRAEWSGPLPPPGALREFDEIIENGAERIFAQFENEATHRRTMEAESAAQDFRERRIGQMLAGGFAFGALCVSALAIVYGAFVTAGIIGGGTIGVVVAAFLRSKRSGAGG